MKISAVIITRDEERNIAAALDSLAGIASEIVVVDSLSTDRTVKIAREYTDRVVERAWTNYADQKNFADGLAVHPWILSLDADERLSPELRAEILALLPSDPDCAAFSMPRRVFYLGKWIRHSGWYPSPDLPEHRRAPGPHQPVLRSRRAEALCGEEEMPLAPPRPPAGVAVPEILCPQGRVPRRLRRAGHLGLHRLRHLRPVRQAPRDLEKRRAH
jgi:hypothetical protein